MATTRVIFNSLSKLSILTYFAASSVVAAEYGSIFPSNTVNSSLVFWNRLGSATEISSSSVGPSGTKQTGVFVPGVFGGALQVSTQNISGVLFPPTVVPRTEGCIEFWAKVQVNSSVLPPDACIQLLKFENENGALHENLWVTVD